MLGSVGWQRLQLVVWLRSERPGARPARPVCYLAADKTGKLAEAPAGWRK